MTAALTLAPWALRNAWTLGTPTPLPPPIALTAQGKPGAELLYWFSTWHTDRRLVPLFLFAYPNPDVAVPPEASVDHVDQAMIRRVLTRATQRVADGGPARIREDDRLFAMLRRRFLSEKPWQAYLTVPVQQVVTLWTSSRSEGWVDWPPVYRLLSGGTYGLVLVLTGLGLWWGPWPVLIVPVYQVVARTLIIPLARVPTEPRYTVEALPMMVALACWGLYGLWCRSRRRPS